MAFTLPTVIPLGSKSRISNPTIYTGVNEFHHNYHPRNYRGNSNYSLWIRIKQMVRRQYYSYFSNIWRNSRYRFSLYDNNSWFRLFTRNSRKSSQCNSREDRNRQSNRNYCYYYILIYILAIGVPAYASEGETNNTSNPVAAATGNVTNQAVQFQNNGAPSRQVIGPNISCNGATMTFSPFYMGNHTTPFDEHMSQQSYTVAENWGGQINFMVPLDGSLVERCKAAADRQLEKMRLEYEMARVLKCGELQQKGFMIIPHSRVWNMCSDVIPIKAYEKELKKKNPPPPKKWYQKLNPFKK